MKKIVSELNFKDNKKNLRALGRRSVVKIFYDPSLLERVSFAGKNCWTSFITKEFTSLCPVTGQPDFATIIINYIADQFIVESKSLKLYLTSFRASQAFHEEVIQTICHDLTQLIDPHYIEVRGVFHPRGGIAIYPFNTNAKGKYKALEKERMINYQPYRLGQLFDNF